jgi:hypothetical protein
MSLKCKLGLHSWDGYKCAECGKIRDEQHNLSIKMRKYSIPEWNIEFMIPNEWEIIIENHWEQPNYFVFAIAGHQTDSIKPTLMLITQIVKDDGTGLDVYMDNAIKQLKNGFANFELIKKFKCTYKGVPSAEMEYTYETSNGKIRELNITNYFGETQKLSFQFVCEASNNTAKNDQILQRSIINSLRIGSNGIRVPYLNPHGFSLNCKICGRTLTEPNALFKGMNAMSCICDNCWRTEDSP